MADDCVHGGLAYIGVSVGGTRTPRKTEHACVGNRREQPMDSWVNVASLRGELKGRDQSKDRVKQRLFMGTARPAWPGS